jgi:hypothetical protein
MKPEEIILNDDYTLTKNKDGSILISPNKNKSDVFITQIQFMEVDAKKETLTTNHFEFKRPIKIQD